MRDKAQRTTGSRIRILACLLKEQRPLTHSEVEDCLSENGKIDRVTVYRVLDWLADTGLAHKVFGNDQVVRYSAQPFEPEHAHPHFQCERCGKVRCLEGVDYAVSLPPGYYVQEISCLVTGVCPECT